MTKKEYQKPVMNVEQLDTQDFLLVVSQVEATGLGEDLNYNGGSGDMGDAYSRRHGSVWNDDEEDW